MEEKKKNAGRPHVKVKKKLKASTQRTTKTVEKEIKNTYLRETRQKASRYKVFIDLEQIEYHRNIYNRENTEIDKSTNPSRNQESIFQGENDRETSRYKVFIDLEQIQHQRSRHNRKTIEKDESMKFIY